MNSRRTRSRSAISSPGSASRTARPTNIITSAASGGASTSSPPSARCGPSWMRPSLEVHRLITGFAANVVAGLAWCGGSHLDWRRPVDDAARAPGRPCGARDRRDPRAGRVSAGPGRRRTSVSASAGRRRTPPAPPVGPTVTLAALAQFEPPPYVAPVLRGSEDEAQRMFQAAMTDYLQGDHAKAIDGLRLATSRDPRASGAGFFLGVSLLLTKQTQAGITELKRTIALGDSPYPRGSTFLSGERPAAGGRRQRSSSGAARPDRTWR